MADVDKISRRITKNVLDKYGVLLHTIGVYSVNTQDTKIIQAQSDVAKIVFSHDGILEMHGFHLDKTEKTISFDIIIDFKKANHEEIYRKIYDEIQAKFPEYKVEIILDLDVSD